MRLGDFLLKEKKITEEKLQHALEVQKKEPGKLGSVLIRLGHVTEEDIAQVLSKQFGYPSINLSKFEIDEKVIELIKPDIARKHVVIPIHRIGSNLTLAMADPSNLFVQEEIRFSTNLRIQAVIAPESSILEAIDKYYGSSTGIEAQKFLDEIELSEDSTVEVMETKDDEGYAEGDIDEDAPAIKLVNLIFNDAIIKGASDIHFEPYEKEFRVRLRIDGVLHEYMKPPMNLKNKVTSRLKLIAGIDIAERRLPQDGRIKTKIDTSTLKKVVDMRVSSLPTIHGEKIVIRILDKDQLKLDMTQLGFEPLSLQKFEKNIKEPLGDHPGHRADRLGQDQHPVFRRGQAEQRGSQHPDRGKPGRIQHLRHQPGQHQGADRPDLPGRPAHLPAPGPQHHPGGRNPRLRDRRHRHQGRPDRPPGAFHPAHQRRPLDHRPPDQHGHRALPGGQRRAPGPGPAADPPPVQRLQGGRQDPGADADRDRLQPRRSQGHPDLRSPRAATSATTPATRAASACSRSWSSTRRSAK